MMKTMMKSNKKTAVITGATGMLGLALMRKLTQEGYHIYAVTRPNSVRMSNIPAADNITKVECALESYETLADLIGEKCDSFYHFAWDGTFGAARDDMEIQTRNIRASVYAAQAAVNLGCRVFVGAGSQAEYGRKDAQISPDTPTAPETGYGAAKLCAGQMTRIVCKKNDVKHIWCRVFSVYGPYDNSHTMIMSVINALLDGVKPSCTAGEQIWDYLYCDDAAEAFYLAAEKGKDGAVYCIGSGNSIPLREYITELKNTVNSKSEIGFGEIPYYPNQVMYLCSDISSLKNDTGFKPRYSFARGISQTVEWAKEEKRKTNQR